MTRLRSRVRTVSGRRRRRYFYLARVTLTVTKTDILRGPRSLKAKHDKQ